MSDKVTTKLYDLIIEIAKDVFREKGFENTTMRDIANALSISVGNLTYHFKKKEDLLETVVIDFYKDYKAPMPCNDINELKGFVNNYEKFKKDNLFWLKSKTKIYYTSERIIEIQRIIFNNNLSFWKETLFNFSEKGLFVKEEFEGQFDELSKRLLFLKIYWNEFEEVFGNTEVVISSYSDALWGVLYPIFTTTGKKLYFEIIKGETI